MVAECVGGGTLEFPIALGRAPDAAKQRRGDARTPEGDYRISGPAQTSRFHRFLPIDYPSRADAERGLAEGRIGRADYRAIIDAHDRGVPPPQQTNLGGHLGFHGEGARWHGWLDLDWTQGCIALRDEDIDQLVDLAPPGTPVRILP